MSYLNDFIYSVPERKDRDADPTVKQLILQGYSGVLPIAELKRK